MVSSPNSLGTSTGWKPAVPKPSRIFSLLWTAYCEEQHLVPISIAATWKKRLFLYRHIQTVVDHLVQTHWSSHGHEWMKIKFTPAPILEWPNKSLQATILLRLTSCWNESWYASQCWDWILGCCHWRHSCSVLGSCRSQEGKVSFHSSLPPTVTHVWFRLQGTSSWAFCPETCVAVATNSDFLLQKNQVGNIRS